MEILGVGIPEIGFIIVIALILLGPKDMVAAGRTFGKTLRQFLTSPAWLAMRRTGEELQQLPTKLVREAGLEELQKEVEGVTNQIRPSEIKRTFDEALVFGKTPGIDVPLKPDHFAPVSPAATPDGKTEPPATKES